MDDGREKQVAFSAQVDRLKLSAEERAERPTDRRVWIAVGVAFAIAIAGTATLLHRGGARRAALPEASAQTTVAAPAAPGPAAMPSPVPAAGSIVAGGRVEAATRLELSVAQPGVVGRVLVAKGDRVKAGAVLVELAADDARAEVELRRAAVESANARLSELREGARAEEVVAATGEVSAAEATYADAHARAERDRRLAASGSIAASQQQESAAQESVARARLAQAQARLALVKRGARGTSIAAVAAEVARAQAELAKAESQLAALIVVAPIDGVVLDVKLGPGEAAAAGAPVVILADLDHLVIKADVPEVHVPRLRVGDKAEGIVEAIAGRAFRAEVAHIALEADRQKGTVEVTVRLLEIDERIRPRMSARVSITPLNKP